VNPFATDHPLASEPSWFDRREHPWLSFICSTLVTAAILAPFILIAVVQAVISDKGPDPYPSARQLLVWGSAAAGVISLCAAVPLVCIGRLLWCCWRMGCGVFHGITKSCRTGNETPPEPAGGDACATRSRARKRAASDSEAASGDRGGETENSRK
jgi:hypothetical protein